MTSAGNLLPFGVPFGLQLAKVLGLLLIGIWAIGGSRSVSATRIVYGACLGLSLIGLAGALAQLLSGAVATTTLPLGLPWIGAHLRLDALSAFFVLLVDLGAAMASLYGLGYGRHEHEPQRVLPFYPVFIAGMSLVLLADDAFTFLLAWEVMSLASWALVVSHHRDADGLRAGYVYLLMASFGTLALLLAFGLMAGPAGGYGFDTIRAGEHSSLTTALVLILMLLGAGSKAGLVPLHVWLPLAHPAAPSHVSALMSGVMTKVAVYGFLRVVLDLLGQPPWWSAALLLVLGAATALLGILHALMETDIKRMLAYSTIENIGVVFVCLGLTLAFQIHAMPTLAALALTAALLHALNHAVFKSLLFLGAGAVVAATGERDMDRQGGLIHRLPVTSVVFLAGCVAISALPPLNGFVSEWLAFQAVLQSPALPQLGLKIMVPAIGGILALAAALAAACFVRAYGVTFLGRPRSEAARTAGEVGRPELWAMGILTGLCVLLGVLPGLAIDALSPVTMQLLQGRMPAQASVAWLSIVPVAESRSSYNGLLVLVFIALCASLAVWVIHRLASRELRRGPAWDCGFPADDPAMQYTATSFAQPLRRVFGTIAFQARETVVMPEPGDIAPARHAIELQDLVWTRLYLPIALAVEIAAKRLNHLQFLTIRRYLSLVFLSLVSLLLVLALWS